MNIEWANLQEGEWSLYLAKTEKGLCYIGSDPEFEEFESSLKKYIPAAVLAENKDALQPYMMEIQEFLQGKRHVFSMDLDVKGTPFQEDVWEALAQIPYGKTVSYSDIAEKINRPQAVRAAGKAIGANPLLIAVPCHRVIGKNGAITGYRGGVEMKQTLLELEKQG
ncbi:MAG: methylated-DNA--[protein]-cysteine S-methyltransferase [Bacillota bacterium]|uniref:methylated-DNA--[protein]-cysteine S-methyltransferase n=1 Tax=Bacillaceae TaxID=186817 RepID=UPI0013D6F320|nr:MULTISPECIES: methylated-DNA--[protein]-cysteine S-methyltransferase [Bacillaceae]MCS0655461.1 methylated-DNA--[protein]-cysteine S-methyltransferase [Cytobacillus firmus]WHY34924.1 methylated-DNA--[protein]-cysteine S-methyltransferase [Cytobacillus firmus]